MSDAELAEIETRVEESKGLGWDAVDEAMRDSLFVRFRADIPKLLAEVRRLRALLTIEHEATTDARLL